MIKQLLSNIERNRVKWRKDVFESDTLSLGRKMAMQGVKDKIDQQAQVLQEEEIDIKDKVDKLRHRHEQLKSLKQKLEHLQRDRADSDRRRAQLKEAQVDFDKYLRFYAKDSKTLRRQKRSYQIEETTEIATFKQRWADFLVEEQAGEDDLRPMLGLDSYDPAPKPYRIFSRHEVSSAIHRNQLGVNLMFDREIQRIRQNKDNLRGFLFDQQKWLSNMKTDLSSYKHYGVSSSAGLGVNAFYPRQ